MEGSNHEQRTFAAAGNRRRYLRVGRGRRRGHGRGDLETAGRTNLEAAGVSPVPLGAFAHEELPFEQLVVFRGKRLLGLGGHGNLPKGGKHPCEWNQSSGACHAPQ